MLPAALPFGASAEDTYTVTFDPNGVDYEFPSFEVQAGKSLYNCGFDYRLVFYTPESDHNDYIVVGDKVIDDWYLDPECTQWCSFSDYEFTKDTTLYARWVKAIKEVRADFNPKAAGLTRDEFFSSNFSVPTPDGDNYYIDIEDSDIYDVEADHWLDSDEVLQEGKTYTVELDFDDIYDDELNRSVTKFAYGSNFKNYLNGVDLTEYCDESEWIYFSFVCKSYRLGDVNDDGNINTQDALLSVRYAKKTLEPTNDKQKGAADVNEDGKLDTKDSMMIINAAKTRTDPFFKVNAPIYGDFGVA